jgi:hypothetical protein
MSSSSSSSAAAPPLPDDVWRLILSRSTWTCVDCPAGVRFEAPEGMTCSGCARHLCKRHAVRARALRGHCVVCSMHDMDFHLPASRSPSASENA